MPHRLLSSYPQFEKIIRSYHDSTKACEVLTYWYVYSQLHVKGEMDLLSQNGFALALEAYTVHWGGLQRVVGNDNRRLRRTLFLCFLRNREIFNQLRSASFRDFNDDHLSNLYEDLCDARFTRGGTSRRFGPTGTGKLLHMLLPNICVIWDNEIVRKRWHLRDDGAAYVFYVRQKWRELDRVMTDFSKHQKVPDVIAEIESEHSRYLARIGFPGVHEPISKLLDECNYNLSDF